MDPLTHALSGAVLARALPREPIPTRYLWLLVGLAMLPDIDIVLKFVSDIFYLRHHRGVTHSILMLPLWIWLIHSLIPGKQPRHPLMPWLIGSALLTHIFLDLITSFGTMIYAPFSDARATLDLVFIIDPIFTALLVFPLLLILPLKRHARTIALASLSLAIAYLSLTAVYHQKGTELTRKWHPNAEHVHAMPLPFSPFHWMLVAGYPDRVERTAVNFVPGFFGTAPLFPAAMVEQFTAGTGSEEKLNWQTFRPLSTLENIDSLPGIAFYRWFARFPVILGEDRDHLLLADLRFETLDLKREAFRLYINKGEKPQAWLIWNGEKRMELTQDDAPPTSW